MFGLFCLPFFVSWEFEIPVQKLSLLEENKEMQDLFQVIVPVLPQLLSIKFHLVYLVTPAHDLKKAVMEKNADERKMEFLI